MKTTLVPLLSLWALAACASTQGLRTAPLDAGVARVYPDSLDPVAAAAEGTVRSAGLTVDTILYPDSQTVMIIARSGSSVFSYGEIVRVLMQRLPSGETSVRVHTVPRLATNLTYTRWNEDIFGALGRALARARSVSPATDANAATPHWGPSMEALRSLRTGAVIRVTTPSGRRQGPVSIVTDTMLTLGSSAIPASALDSLWTRKSNAKTGALVGALVGSVIGLVIASHQQRQSCDLSQYPCGQFAVPALIVMGGMLGGAAVGAGIGSAIPRWRLRFP